MMNSFIKNINTQSSDYRFPYEIKPSQNHLTINGYH